MDLQQTTAGYLWLYFQISCKEYSHDVHKPVGFQKLRISKHVKSIDITKIMDINTHEFWLPYALALKSLILKIVPRVTNNIIQNTNDRPKNPYLFLPKC